MASGYNTGQYQPIDFLAQMPKELMLAAIQNADAQNQKIDDTAGLLKDELLKVKFLEADREAVVRKQQEYNTAIDELTTKLGADRTNWRSQMGAIRDLGRRLSSDLTTGELSAIQGQYTQYQTSLAEAKARLDRKEIRQDQFDKTLQAGLNSFTGTNWKSPTEYNKINIERPVDYVDFNKVVQDSVKDMEKQGYTKEFDSFSGGYIWRNKNKTETRTYKDIVDAAYSTALQDEKVMDYYRQGSRLGYTGNMYNDDGTMKPLYVDKTDVNGEKVVAKDAKGQPLKDALGQPVYEKEMNGAHPWALGLNAAGLINQLSNIEQSTTQQGAEVYGKAAYDDKLARGRMILGAQLDEQAAINTENRAEDRANAKAGVSTSATLPYLDEVIKQFPPSMLENVSSKLGAMNQRIKNKETLTPQELKEYQIYQTLNQTNAERYAKEAKISITEQNELEEVMGLYNSGQTDSPRFKELVKKISGLEPTSFKYTGKADTKQEVVNPGAWDIIKGEHSKMATAFNNYGKELSDAQFTQRAVVIDDSTLGKQLKNTFDIAASIIGQDGNTFDPTLNPDFGKMKIKVVRDGWWYDSSENFSSAKLSEMIKNAKGDTTKSPLIPTRVSQQADGSITYSVKVNPDVVGNRVKITDVNGNEVKEFKWTINQPHIYNTNIDIVNKSGNLEALKGVVSDAINHTVTYNLNRVLPQSNVQIYNPELPTADPVVVSRLDKDNYQVQIPNNNYPYTPIVETFSSTDKAKLEVNNYMRQQVLDSKEAKNTKSK